MAIDRLKKDLAELGADVKLNAATVASIQTVEDMKAHLADTLWPTFEAIVDRMKETVDEVDDLDAAVIELAADEGDMLSEETGGVFANVLLMSASMATALEARLTPADGELKTQLAQYRALLEQAGALLTEITVPEGEDDDEEDEDGED